MKAMATWGAMGVVMMVAWSSMPVVAADETIQIKKTIPYKDGVGTPAVRAECRWNQEISNLIVKGSNGLVVATEGDLASTGRILDIVITDVHSVGGDVVSGPKWGTLHGELKENGQIVHSFDVRRATMRPFVFKSCSNLSNVAKALAGDVLAWLKNPEMKFEQEATAP